MKMENLLPRLKKNLNIAQEVKSPDYANIRSWRVQASKAITKSRHEFNGMTTCIMWNISKVRNARIFQVIATLAFVVP
jgi:hypothetical protein